MGWSLYGGNNRDVSRLVIWDGSDLCTKGSEGTIFESVSKPRIGNISGSGREWNAICTDAPDGLSADTSGSQETATTAHSEGSMGISLSLDGMGQEKSLCGRLSAVFGIGLWAEQNGMEHRSGGMSSSYRGSVTGVPGGTRCVLWYVSSKAGL